MDKSGVMFIACFFSMLGVLTGQSCKTPQAIVVIRAAEPCLVEPPPVPKPVKFPACVWFRDAGADPQVYVACLDSHAADTLIKDLEASKRWQGEAWLRCGALDAGR